MSAVLPASALPAGDAIPIERAIVEASEPSAADRLAASRLRLRAALMDIAHPPPRPSIFDGLGDVKGLLLDKVKTFPGASLLLDSLEGWWAQHPLHAAGLVAEEATRSFVLPAARRNPYGVILASVIVGGLFVVSKPWKWLLRPALFVGLVPQLAAHALQKMPIESWVQMLSSILPAKRAQKEKDKEKARADAAPDLPQDF